jgi:hypothetical protein
VIGGINPVPLILICRGALWLEALPGPIPVKARPAGPWICPLCNPGAFASNPDGGESEQQIQLAPTCIAFPTFDHDRRFEQASAHLLASVYAWFTDGFGTKDLKDAKAPLDELEPAAARAAFLPDCALFPNCNISVVIRLLDPF